MNSYLCEISDASNEFFEETRKNYIDLQMRVEGNSQTLDGYGEQLVDLSQSQTDMNLELDNLSDSVDCGVTGTVY